VIEIEATGTRIAATKTVETRTTGTKTAAIGTRIARIARQPGRFPDVTSFEILLHSTVS
jgi:hypothetical protein